MMAFFLSQCANLVGEGQYLGEDFEAIGTL